MSYSHNSKVIRRIINVNNTHVVVSFSWTLEDFQFSISHNFQMILWCGSPNNSGPFSVDVRRQSSLALWRPVA